MFPMSDDLIEMIQTCASNNMAILGSRYTGAGNFINTA